MTVAKASYGVDKDKITELNQKIKIDNMLTNSKLYASMNLLALSVKLDC